MIREAFYSAKKLEKPRGGWNGIEVAVCHNSSLNVRRKKQSRQLSAKFSGLDQIAPEVYFNGGFRLHNISLVRPDRCGKHLRQVQQLHVLCPQCNKLSQTVPFILLNWTTLLTQWDCQRVGLQQMKRHLAKEGLTRLNFCDIATSSSKVLQNPVKHVQSHIPDRFLCDVNTPFIPFTSCSSMSQRKNNLQCCNVR